MRWIDVDLVSLARDAALDGPLAAVAARDEELLQIQRDHGLDHPKVTAHLAEVGRPRFGALVAADPSLFRGDAQTSGAVDPIIGLSDTDHQIGYHLIVPGRWLALPWTWLHNGLEFLLERHPLVAATSGSRLPAAASGRPWMKRYLELSLSEQIQGRLPLRKALARLRPRECADPEILFVPGHCREEIRSLIFREADGIRRALAAGSLDRRLANLQVPDQPVTPGMLSRRGSLYQGLHFAASTARPLDAASARESAWITELAAAAWAAGPEDAQLQAEFEGDLEVVGVDPLTTLLDTVTARAERREAGHEPAASGRAGAAVSAPPAWILEDGPFGPESLGGGDRVPALVFSNSYRSLPAMAERFLRAGASAFIGPSVPLYSRPARKFAGAFYNLLGDGHSIGAALRLAALACRERFGPEHPVWLSYGVRGFGTLALQYL